MIDRSKSPLPGGEITFHLPEMKRFALNNGLKVLFVQKEKLPLLQLSLLIRAGSINDASEKAGTAHLTAMMIDEGAGPYNSLELDDEIEKLGSIVSISNNHDSLYVSLLTLIENFERSLELTSLIINDPVMAEEDFKREQYKLENKLQQLYDDPGYIASSNFDRICYKGTNYAQPAMGIKSSISKIELNDIKDFYTNHFSPQNAELIVVGNISQADLEDKLNTYLSSWKSNKVEVQKEMLFVPKSKTIHLIHKEDSAQTEIRVGNLTSKRRDGDYFDKMIMNTILGGQFSSRINLNLREDKGFTYGANSMMGYNAATGMFRIGTAVNLENTGETLSEIFKEIKGIKEDISSDEIEFAKSFLIKSFPSKFETYGQIATNLNTLVIHNLHDTYYNEYIENVSKVTKETALEAAKGNLKEEDMVIVLVGDRDKIIPQLSNFDYKIVELDIEGNILTS